MLWSATVPEVEYLHISLGLPDPAGDAASRSCSIWDFDCVVLFTFPYEHGVSLFSGYPWGLSNVTRWRRTIFPLQVKSWTCQMHTTSLEVVSLFPRSRLGRRLDKEVSGFLNVKFLKKTISCFLL